MKGDGLYARFVRHAVARPDHVALICGEHRLSYGALGRLVAATVARLADEDIGRGTHLLLALGNDVSHVATLLAAADLGAVLVPVQPDLKPNAIAIAAAASAATHALAPASTHRDLAAAAPHLRLLDNAPILRDADDPAAGQGGPVSGASGAGGPDDPFIISMTSGSTGAPKPILLTQRTKIERAAAAAALYGVTADDRVLAGTPLYHSLALRMTLLPLTLGATCILAPRPSTDRWLTHLREDGITFTIAVSSQIMALNAALEADPGATPPALRCIVSSSAPLPAEAKAALRTRLNAPVHECYGASEIAIATNLGPDAPAEKTASVGVAAPGVEVAILGPAGLAGPGEEGEILCRTPGAFAGYFGRHDLTAEAHWDGFFRTGDIGVIDADGYLHYRGRAKELIISGGMNIYPDDVEAAFAQFPGLRECAAFGLPDPELGEQVALAVVIETGADVTARALRRRSVQALPDFQHPRRFVFLDALPRTPTGKIRRRAIAVAFENGGAA